MAEENDERASQPRALLVTLYGLYAREEGGWLPVASLVTLLGNLGVDEPAVRSSLSRLKRRGILVSARSAGVAGYLLSGEARSIFGEGDRWIFDRPRTKLADGWLLLAFSIPETERAKRHTLRTSLALRGFGIVAPGLWIAPANLHDEIVPPLERLDLVRYVHLFHADYWGLSDLVDLVRTWWDIDVISGMYTAFIASNEGLRRAWQRPIRFDDERAFVDYVHVLTEWRRLPYLDPGLPPELLPEMWPGARAAELFFDLRALLEERSRRHVRRVTDATDATSRRFVAQ